MAERTAPSFATTTVNGYTVRTTTTSSTLAGSTDSLVSENIVPSADSFENKKIVMGMDVKVAFADVPAVLTLQVSHNGSDWVDVSTLSSDTTPNVTGVKTFFVDVSSIYAPYFRLHFNGSSTTVLTTQSVGTSGTMQFFFAYK
tara:strand:+ start:510 stop:938 length:429 start_codon:yes stop_codon:yes gene_type:complete